MILYAWPVFLITELDASNLNLVLQTIFNVIFNFNGRNTIILYLGKTFSHYKNIYSTYNNKNVNAVLYICRGHPQGVVAIKTLYTTSC